MMPDAEKIVLLVRGTLITLNDAIQTGNFTVMRDKGAPGFREANSAARLGQIFSDLAKSGVDLSVVSVITPQLTANPTLDQAKGMLNIQGYFPTQPQQINFELLYQSVGGRWRLFGLSVQPSKATPSPSANGAAAIPPQ
jgi:ABC-type transport system substrate-binding protein